MRSNDAISHNGMDENKEIEMNETTTPEAEVVDTEAATSGIYEVGFQIIPTISADSSLDVFSNLKKVTETHGTEVISSGAPELVDLAYEMRKKIGGKFQRYNQGYFGWIKFAAPVSNIAKLRAEIEKIEEVLRFIITSTVRENTMISQKPIAVKRIEPEEEGIAKEEMTPAAIDQEIDKTLEGLEIK